MAKEKFLNLEGLKKYDEKIKAVISAGDQAAKDYADGLATNYDPAGTAASKANEALEAAKTYADGKDAAIAEAKKAGTDAAAAAAAAQATADTAQGEVDALETLVGQLPEGTTATSVIDYVNVKTSGIATDAALTELNNQVSGLQTAVQGIQADYLVEADKTELSDAITAEADRAKGVEGGLETRLKAVEDDYLKTADKTELESAIEAAEEAAVDRVLGYLAEEEVNTSYDTLKEVAAWIESDTTASAQLVTRVSDAEKAIDDIEADYLKAADKTALQGAIDAKAAQADHEALAGRVTTAEGEIDTLQADVVAAKSAADAAQATADTAQGEVDALEEVVAGKAAAADLTALTGRVATAEGEIDALQADSHTHSNKTELDLIASGDKAKWDAAAAKAHEHSNKTVIDGITAEKVAAWDAAEGNAKAYVDEKVAGVDLSGIATNASAISGLSTRMAAAESDIDALQALVGEGYQAITTAEVEAMFA